MILDFLTRKVALYVSAGLLAALALALLWGWRVDALRAHYKDALAQQAKAYTDAQKAAQTDFDKKLAAAKAKNEELNNAADKKSADVSIVYRDRVLRLPAASCPASGTGLPKADVPESADGPGADAVVLKRDDVLICADNTARLQAAHDWAVEMMK